MSGSVVETSHLTMRYQVGSKTVIALDDLDLRIPAGQFVIMRGRSGSGKTTLLHLIAGLQEPSAGRVVIGDTDIHALPPSKIDEFRCRNIGLVFQFFNLIPSLTVGMNIALPLLLQGHKLYQLEDRVDELVDVLGIGNRRHHAPSELSGGELQRVAIARALIAKPKVLLADEPTGNLDTRTSHEVFALLRDQVESRGITTLVMTHDADVLGYADRVMEVSDGRVRSDSGQVTGMSRSTADES